MKLIYLDAFAGLAGDMFIAALIDAGGDLEVVKDAVDQLGLTHVTVTAQKDRRAGMSGTRFEVAIERHDHAHRTWTHIQAMIKDSGLDQGVAEMALDVFSRLAGAEAAVHGVDPAEVHFHEVGAVDSIVDIVGACALIEDMDVETVMCSPLPMGRGFVDTAHGRLPLPAPATTKLLEGVPVIGDPSPFELVTPTGAALAVALARKFGRLPDMAVEAVGHGLGSRELDDRPNLLRIFVGRAFAQTPRARTETVAVLTTRIDDINPELYDTLIERLMLSGARDVSLTPVIMKKSRPAVEVSVIAHPADARSLSEKLMRESGSLGVRYQEVRRLVLDRRVITVETAHGPVQVKVGDPDGPWPIFAPEFEDVRNVADRAGVPVRVVYQAAVAAATGTKMKSSES